MTPSTRIQLRVSPGAGRSEIVGRYGDAWKLRVTAPPDRGRANEAALRVLAEALGVRPETLTLVSGASSRDKVVELHGLDAAEAERRLEGKA